MAFITTPAMLLMADCVLPVAACVVKAVMLHKH